MLPFLHVPLLPRPGKHVSMNPFKYRAYGKGADLMRRDVSIIILNWNSGGETLECLRSIRNAIEIPGLHVLIVDNGSVDNSVPMLRAAYPEIEILRLERNLGFAEACDLALDIVFSRGSSYVLLLNNDTIVYMDFLTPILDYMENHREAAICGPIVTDFNTRKVQSAGVRVTRFLLDSQVLHTGTNPEELSGHSLPWEVDCVGGCAMVMRTSVLRQVGLFDNRFFFYEEEVDMCIRTRAMGYVTVVVPVLGVYHKGSSSADRMSGFREFHRTRSRIILLGKHHSTPAGTILALAFAARQIILRGAQFLLGRRSSGDMRGLLHGLIAGVTAVRNQPIDNSVPA